MKSIYEYPTTTQEKIVKLHALVKGLPSPKRTGFSLVELMLAGERRDVMRLIFKNQSPLDYFGAVMHALEEMADCGWLEQVNANPRVDGYNWVAVDNPPNYNDPQLFIYRL